MAGIYRLFAMLHIIRAGDVIQGLILPAAVGGHGAYAAKSQTSAAEIRAKTTKHAPTIRAILLAVTKNRT